MDKEKADMIIYTTEDGLTKVETIFDGDTVWLSIDQMAELFQRDKSKRGTQFRIWATGILKEYMRKGFALDDDRLKNLGGGGYFKELLERIRDIRASEKVFYRQFLQYKTRRKDICWRAYESF